MPRAIWSGSISFGLVNIPVKLYNAVSRKNVSFNQIDARTRSRVRMQRVNAEGEEVPYEQIVKGYELSPDQYVLISPEELDGLDPEATHTVDIEMRDIAFSPTSVDVKKGETVAFAFHNAGKVAHDAFIGDETGQMDHEDEMKDGGGMHHGGSDAITVERGKTGKLTHTFDATGTTLIGCHQPRHYAAGMKLAVRVS